MVAGLKKSKCFYLENQTSMMFEMEQLEFPAAINPRDKIIVKKDV